MQFPHLIEENIFCVISSERAEYTSPGRKAWDWVDNIIQA